MGMNPECEWYDYGTCLKAVAKEIKKKFSNLTVEETIDLSSAIIKAIQATRIYKEQPTHGS